MTRETSDRGNVSVLTLGWLVLVVLALLTMAAATQVHIDRMRLAALADEVALAAADEIDPGAYYGGSASEPEAIALAEQQMSDAAATWLAQDPRPWVAEVELIAVSAPDSSTATVELGRTAPTLFSGLSSLPFAEVALTATGSARGN